MSSPAPVGPSEGRPPDDPVPEAPLPRRLAALAYEFLLYAALVLVVGFLTIPLSRPAAPDGSALRVPDLPARVLSFALVFGAGAAYYVASWSGGRRTLPMKTWGLRLVSVGGGAVGPRRALVRYLAAWVGPALALAVFIALRPWGQGAHALWLVAFNFLWAFVDPDRRFLHDRLAGTRIVRDD